MRRHVYCCDCGCELPPEYYHMGIPQCYMCHREEELDRQRQEEKLAVIYDGLLGSRFAEEDGE